MRRQLLLLPLALLLPACVYTSPVPLDRPGAAPFDEALLGTWTTTDEGTADTLAVERAGPDEYLVRFTDEVKAAGQPVQRVQRELRAHRSVVGNASFLNVFDPDDDKYMFVRYEASGDDLSLRFLQGGSSPVDPPGTKPLLGEYDDSEGLRAAVLGLLDDPRILDQEATVLRRRGRG